MQDRKIYVIGSGSELVSRERIKKILEANGCDKAVFIGSISDIPEKERFSSELLVISGLHKHSTPIPIRPIIKDIQYETEPKRKGHERPYKYHR